MYTLHSLLVGVTSLFVLGFISCRYLVFFSPLDVCYGLCHFVPVNLALWVVKELARAKKAYSGVLMASTVYPDSLLAMAVVGMLKGEVQGKEGGGGGVPSSLLAQMLQTNLSGQRQCSSCSRQEKFGPLAKHKKSCNP